MRLRHRSAPSTHLRLSRAGLPATGRAVGSRPLIGEWRTQTVPPQRRAVHGLPVPESPAASPRGAGRGVARRLRPPPVTEPPATVTGNHHMLVRHNTPGGDVGQMCTPATEPARTLPTTGHQSLVGWPPAVPVPVVYRARHHDARPLFRSVQGRRRPRGRSQHHVNGGEHVRRHDPLGGLLHEVGPGHQRPPFTARSNQDTAVGSTASSTSNSGECGGPGVSDPTMA
jgi:hypothetical protein